MIYKNFYRITCLAITLVTPISAHAWETPAKIVCAAFGGLFLGKTFTNHNYTRAHTTYARVQQLINHSDTRLSAELRHEIASHHKDVCLNYPFGTHPYRYYPLLHYKKELDTTISDLELSLCISFGMMHHAEDVRILLCDLRHLRYLIESEREYVMQLHIYTYRERMEEYRRKVEYGT